ncbi:hypothetical protein TIFTF001_003169 [Ficus carica]|uniref:Uncharacterized protein n=1 Tax=Ficus carica TaxID=3494 RepID=A0AA88CVE6_FICCA|nr:hypothetical protein TIFTF001_003169 [Ficus carica]
MSVDERSQRSGTCICTGCLDWSATTRVDSLVGELLEPGVLAVKKLLWRKRRRLRFVAGGRGGSHRRKQTNDNEPENFGSVEEVDGGEGSEVAVVNRGLVVMGKKRYKGQVGESG